MTRQEPAPEVRSEHDEPGRRRARPGHAAPDRGPERAEPGREAGLGCGGSPPGELVPIDQVARELGLRASAIRYYEERGLVASAARRSGKRCYDRAAVRRLAVVRYWQESGLLSLDRIAALLAGPSAGPGWTGSVRAQIDELSARIDRMAEARELLRHILDHHPADAPDGCPHFESLIWQRPAGPGQGAISSTVGK
jgi:MerR family transcriptional regulator, copper efflux regulator